MSKLNNTERLEEIPHEKRTNNMAVRASKDTMRETQRSHVNSTLTVPHSFQPALVPEASERQLMVDPAVTAMPSSDAAVPSCVVELLMLK